MGEIEAQHQPIASVFEANENTHILHPDSSAFRNEML